MTLWVHPPSKPTVHKCPGAGNNREGLASRQLACWESLLTSDQPPGCLPSVAACSPVTAGGPHQWCSACSDYRQVHLLCKLLLTRELLGSSDSSLAGDELVLVGKTTESIYGCMGCGFKVPRRNFSCMNLELSVTIFLNPERITGWFWDLRDGKGKR